MSAACSWLRFQSTLADLAGAARLVEAFGTDQRAGLEVLCRDGVLESPLSPASLFRVGLVYSEEHRCHQGRRTRHICILQFQHSDLIPSMQEALLHVVRELASRALQRVRETSLRFTRSR